VTTAKIVISYFFRLFGRHFFCERSGVDMVQHVACCVKGVYKHPAGQVTNDEAGDHQHEESIIGLVRLVGRFTRKFVHLFAFL